MSDNNQSVDKHEEKADSITEPCAAYRAGTGIGGGLVGAAIGGLLGRRVGGVFGAVAGAVTGALVGKATAVRVNHTVESVVDAARSVAETVNHNVNGVGNALKDTVEEVKPSVKGVVDAVKDTVEEVKPSVVGAAKSVAEAVNHTVNGVGNALKDTPEEVKPSVVGVLDAAKPTPEEVKPSVIDVENALKDTAEEVQPSVIAVEDAAKPTPEEAKPSVIAIEDALKDTPEEVKPSVVGVEHAAKPPAEEVNPSVVGVEDAAQATPEEVKPSDNHDSKLDEEKLVGVQLSRSSQEHPLRNDVNEQARQSFKNSKQSKNVKKIDIKSIENKNIQQTQKELKRNQQETVQNLKPQKIKLLTEKITNVMGIIVGSATITLIGVTLGLSPKPNLIGTKSPEYNQVTTSSELAIKSAGNHRVAKPAQVEREAQESNIGTKSPQLAKKSPKSNQSLSLTPEKTPKTIADGWIFIGNINNASASELAGKSLMKGSQFIDSPVVPSVGSIVSVTVSPGVTLRKNRPQKPKFNPKEQKALATIKPREKLKILKVESVTPSNTTRPVTQLWAQVYRCGAKSATCGR